MCSQGTQHHAHPPALPCGGDEASYSGGQPTEVLGSQRHGAGGDLGADLDLFYPILSVFTYTIIHMQPSKV